MRLRTAIAATLVAGGVAAGGAHAAPPTTEPSVLSETLQTLRDARQAGGPGKDGIPSIDEPEFVSADEAEDMLEDHDRVIGVYRNGEARAYPQRILVWHEIVNDTFGGERIAVTYCPLTGTALGFDRGDTELGVSGKLVNSNLVMYDRATDTEYPQILGAGIAGPLAGEGLREIRIFWTEWARWRERHPATKVLSTETGFFRNYRVDPYGRYADDSLRGYYAEDSRPIFPVLHRDARYPNKREILGFRDRELAVAVDRDHLREARVIRHETPGASYLVIHDPVLDTGWVYRGDSLPEPDPDAITFAADGPRFDGRDAVEAINAFEAMWFAWHAFYPDTEVLDR